MRLRSRLILFMFSIFIGGCTFTKDLDKRQRLLSKSYITQSISNAKTIKSVEVVRIELNPDSLQHRLGHLSYSAEILKSGVKPEVTQTTSASQTVYSKDSVCQFFFNVDQCNCRTRSGSELTTIQNPIIHPKQFFFHPYHGRIQSVHSEGAHLVVKYIFDKRDVLSERYVYIDTVSKIVSRVNITEQYYGSLTTAYTYFFKYELDASSSQEVNKEPNCQFKSTFDISW